MCGICGIYEYGRSGPADLSPVGAMTDQLVHRGPDGEGTWFGPRVALGHRRLSIFDLSTAGAQPMCSPDGKLVISFNGEIYNFKELRALHEKRGLRFRSGTDTEVILAEYRQRGIDSLQAFRGMFAFALWDEDRQTLYVVRDRLGIKPLYYVNVDGILVFASEIGSLLAHPRVSAVLDRERLAEWLALRYTSSPFTLFRGVRKLEPGHYLAVDARGVRKVRYWDVRFEAPLRRRGEALEQYREVFREAVHLRMRADVPVGVLLSGGFDSSVVAAEAQAAASGTLHTFSVGFANTPGISELEHAQRVSRHIGSTHHELLLDDVPLDTLRDSIRHLEEPIGDPAAVLVYQLAEFARRHVTVALSGEGSDETNLGYAKAAAFSRWAGFRETPLAGTLLGRVWLARNASGTRAWSPWPVEEPLVYAELGWPGARRRATATLDSKRWLDGLRQTLDGAAVPKCFSRMLYLDLKGWMADDLLLKVDKNTMAHALETRVPFLDHRLVELNLRIPPEWKVGPSGTKLFAREALRDRIPERTADRSQHGFISPLQSWLEGLWVGQLEHALSPDGLDNHGLFRPGYLQRMRQRVAARDAAANVEAFMLIALDIWKELFHVEFAV